MPEPTTPQLTEREVEEIEAHLLRLRAPVQPWESKTEPAETFNNVAGRHALTLCQSLRAALAQIAHFESADGAGKREDVPTNADDLVSQLVAIDGPCDCEFGLCEHWQSEAGIILTAARLNSAALREQLAQITGERDGLKRRIEEMRDERR